MTKQAISEEMGVHKDWPEEARKVKDLDELVAFAKRLGEDYEHDYGTICHATSAVILAAGHAFDSTYGGITGFQAGCVMWGFVREWLHQKGPLKLVKYEDMLFPQYDEELEKTIPQETWRWLQREAKERLAANGSMADAVRKHMQSIADGKVPFGYTVRGKR